VLRRTGLIAEWHDRKIMPGEDWAHAIDRNLASADIILLLVSSTFINSDYCWGKEMIKALERDARGDAKVVPIILRPCQWHLTPLSRLQALPREARAVTLWSNADEAFDDVAAGIVRVVEDLRAADAARREAAAEATRQKAEAERLAEDARRKAEEDQERAAADAKRQAEEEVARRRAAEEASRREAEEARRKADEEERERRWRVQRAAEVKQEADARRKADEDRERAEGEASGKDEADREQAASTQSDGAAKRGLRRWLLVAAGLVVLVVSGVWWQQEQVAEAERRRIAAEATARAEMEARKAEAKRKPGDTFRDCDVCPEMVVLAGGTFTMGSPAGEAGRDSDEGPQRQVTIAPFAIGKTEVTFEQWDACVTAGGCNGHRPSDAGWGRGSRPVINVSWNDAQAYVAWLSNKTGRTYRLPTEAEWEYAARAGTTTPFSFGATISTAQANYDGDYTYGSGSKGEDRRRTVPAGSLPANPWGLHEVHGNVWEWVEDCYHASYQGAPTNGRAWVDQSCTARVLRGGSWVNDPGDLRSAGRGWGEPDTRDDNGGFRVARTLLGP
jgi:formylglycine-generating enzyme required for sulfatase activity